MVGLRVCVYWFNAEREMKWPADIDGKPNKAIGNNPRGDTGDASAVYDHSLPWKSSIIHCGRYRRLI